MAPYWRMSSSSTEPSGRPSTYSMTMYGITAPSPPEPPLKVTSASPVSNTETMFVCDSFATAWASRRNRSRKDCSRPRSLCSVLMATCRSSAESYARYTDAMPPAPSKSLSW